MARNRKMTAGDMVAATDMAKSRVDACLELAQRVATDYEAADRRARLECKACYHFPRWGGTAITESKCGICGETIMNASTNTDAICKPCAEEHDLCRHCGGDREMRTRRRRWPELPEVQHE